MEVVVMGGGLVVVVLGEEAVSPDKDVKMKMSHVGSSHIGSLVNIRVQKFEFEFVYIYALGDKMPKSH
jgi:hypothetical protein